MDIAPPTHLSLCAGYEGIGIGLKRVFPSCRTIAAVEAEAFCAANLVDKMETGALAPMPVFTDITQFDGSPFRGMVDIASGGFPCTPFSCAGLRESDGSENHLFPYILKTIKATEPSIVFLENVEGIISSKHRNRSSVRPRVTGAQEIQYAALARPCTRSMDPINAGNLFSHVPSEPNGITTDGRYNSVVVFCETVVQCASYLRCALHVGG